MVLQVRLAPTPACKSLSLLRVIQYSHPPSCPCHSNIHPVPSTPLLSRQHGDRSLAIPANAASGQKEYAFKMAASNIRFGPGCTREVGMDLKNLGRKKVCVFTDANVG